jgi:alpha-tubulin suppressor-like RCC1 family protein
MKQGTQFYTQQLIDISSNSVSSIKSGIRHAVALTKTNELYTWGYNNLGQLGYTNSEEKSSLKTEFNFETGEMFEYSNSPNSVPFFHKNNHSMIVTQISCGDNFTIALTSGGKMFGWGDNSYCQLGMKNDKSHLVTFSESENSYYMQTPNPISCFSSDKTIFTQPEESKIQKVISGSTYTYAITTDLKIFFFGQSKYGLNLKPNSCIESKPLHLHSLDAKKIRTLATYDSHVLCLGHTIELEFSHSEKEGSIKMIGIPNDYGVMDITNFSIKDDEIFIISESDLPYALLKKRPKKSKMKAHQKTALIQKLLKKTLSLSDEELNPLSQEEEESESE